MNMLKVKLWWQFWGSMFWLNSDRLPSVWEKLLHWTRRNSQAYRTWGAGLKEKIRNEGTGTYSIYMTHLLRHEIIVVIIKQDAGVLYNEFKVYAASNTS